MASFQAYKPGIGTKDYLTKYDDFIDASETVAQEIENARETATSGATSLLQNLTENYAKYILEKDIEGGAVTGTSDATGGTNYSLVDLSATFVTDGIVTGDILVDLTNSDETGLVYSTVVGLSETSILVTEENTNGWNSVDYSVGGKACKNMPPAIYPNDYATKGYLDNLTGSGVTDITDIGTGDLNANDVLVINSTGTAITGRPTQFYTNANGTTPITASFKAAFNDNANIDCSGGIIDVTLPVGRVGGIVTFTDVEGTIDDTHYFRVKAASTGDTPAAPSNQYIMGTIASHPSTPQYLVADVNAHTGFSLVYVDDTFGWAIINLQR